MKEVHTTAKANLSHTHAQSDITNLTTTLAAKAPLASPTLTGTPTAPTAATGTNNTQIATTAFVATAVGTKQATVTGAATTITGSNLTASRALISNSSGKVAVSDITAAELSCLDGVTSNVQTQLNGKQSTITLDANVAVVTDGDGKLTKSAYITTTELNMLNNARSNIQTQIDSLVGYPDYSSVTAILQTNGATYTTTERGCFFIRCDTEKHFFTGTIGSLTISVGSNTAGYYQNVSTMFPVPKGTTIKRTNGDGYFYFMKTNLS